MIVNLTVITLKFRLSNLFQKLSNQLKFVVEHHKAVQLENGLSGYTNLIIAVVLVMSIITNYPLTGLSSSMNFEYKMLSSGTDIKLLEERLPRTIIQDPNTLAQIKLAAIGQNDSIIQEFLKKIIAEADSFLSKIPNSVIEKTELPPSGNKHDFYSLAPFEWPNPNTRDGLPYVSRDGKINPEIYSISDKRNMDDMVRTVKMLSLAYYFTNESKYASKAEEILRVWFLDKDTYMNPHLKYAETERGNDMMNPRGIMEGRPLTELTDAIVLLQQSPGWTNETNLGMQLWFSNYLDWLLNSDSGKEERQKMNNHGTYYMVQVSSIALFLNQKNFTKEILEASMQDLSLAPFRDVPNLIAVKILPDGRQPFELKRTNALDYSLINLLGLFQLASVAERVGVDMWNHEIHGSGIRKALDYILPYALKKDSWPYQQIKPITKNNLAELSCLGMIHYGANELYLEAYKSIETKGQNMNIYYPICNQVAK